MKSASCVPIRFRASSICSIPFRTGALISALSTISNFSRDEDGAYLHVAHLWELPRIARRLNVFTRRRHKEREPENGLPTLSGSHRQKHSHPVRLSGHSLSLEVDLHSFNQTDFFHRHTALAHCTSGFRFA